jgi:hypothetical protein
VILRLCRGVFVCFLSGGDEDGGGNDDIDSQGSSNDADLRWKQKGRTARCRYPRVGILSSESGGCMGNVMRVEFAGPMFV